MDFKITFKCEEKYVKVIDIPSVTLGLDFVDIVRSHSGRDIDVDLFPDAVPSRFEYSVHFYLPEKEAREIGVFNDHSYRKVYVPPYCLNLYINPYYKIRSEESFFGKGKVTEVEVGYIIERSEILEDWVNDGCPTHWNPLEVYD